MTVESPLISVEPSQNSVQPSSTQGKRLFSGEFAKEMAQKSVESRKAKLAEAEQAKAIVAQLQASAIVEPDDLYRLNRLKATREALEGLYSDLKKADDAKDQKAICDSIARLSEVERLLAGRPSPGSHRPSATKSKPRTPESYGPVE